ncbi:MAG: LysR family transcriptional regulator [Treponema sp.]|nr:LysR family transcriptional regulator [Treponema sp.]
MELFQLRYFLEVARQQHVRKSAETLHVSQPAVTNAIHRLEKEIGVPLFVSSGRSIKLSPYGKAFYDEIQPLWDSLDSLPEKIKGLQPRERVMIRLNVFAAWFIVMDAILEFQRIDPDVCFNVTRSEGQELADITVFTVNHYRSRKRKAGSPFVCSEEIFLAVPDMARFRGMDSINLTDVADMGFVMISDKMYFRAICDGFCNVAGIHPNTVFESDDPDAVRFMICNNMGVGFWPEFAMGRTFTDRILLKHIEKPLCKREIVVEKHDINSDNIHVQVFYEFLTHYIDLYHRQHNGVNWTSLA